MKVSVVALRKVLQGQLAAVESAHTKQIAREITERKADLKDAIARAERYIKQAKDMLTEDGPECLRELSAPKHFYGERYRKNEVGADVKRALKLLDLSATDELTLADATRLVGKSIIEAL